MNRAQIVLRLTVFTVGILSVVPVIRATESPRVDANKDAMGDPFAPDSRISLSLSLQGSENLSLRSGHRIFYGRRGIGERTEPQANQPGEQHLVHPVSVQ